MSITRRLFLRNGAVASATVALPAVVEAAAAQPTGMDRVKLALAELRAAMNDHLAASTGPWDVILTGNDVRNTTFVMSNGKHLLHSRGRYGRVSIYVDDGSPLLADDVTGTTAMADWEAKQRRVGA